MMPSPTWLRAAFFAAAILPIALSASARQGTEKAPEVHAPPSAAAERFEHFVVAADHPLASQAGAEILRAGGNAVDAAVATSFALSVLRPFSCGIGGGGFMVIHKDGRSTAINYREMAPRAVGPDYFEKIEDPTASTIGGRAVGVPGTVAGLLYALEKYGAKDRATVLGPAIRLAREGFVADAAYVKAAQNVRRGFEEHPEHKARFPFTWSRFLQSGNVNAGDIIKLPEQAAVLELIAQQGLPGFYQGPVGDAILAAVHADGGLLTAEDLRGFVVKEVEPLKVPFDGGMAISMPPPSSGGIALGQTLGILQRANIAGVVKDANWAAYTQLLTESFKHAFADRARWLGDPDAVTVPTDRLLSPTNLDMLAGQTHISRSTPTENCGSRWPGMELPQDAPHEDGGTSHLCVVDAQGAAVACTETINLLFGSKVAVDKYGFCLNNQMDDFTARRGEANAFGLKQSDLNLPAPRKRPLSSMTPTIVLDDQGRVRAVAGASGGPRIITATAQVLLNALVRGDDAGRAVSRARIHHQWKPDVIEIEPGFDERHNGLGVDIWMTKLHHRTSVATDGAAVQLILRRPGSGESPVWEAACDPRKGGRPAEK